MIKFLKMFNSVILGIVAGAILVGLIWCLISLPPTSILEVVGLIAIALICVALITLLIFCIFYIWETEMIEEAFSK